MEQKPPVKLGMMVGLGLVGALAVLDIGLVVLTLTAPVSLLSVLRGLLVLFSVPVMGLVVYGLSALSNASYTVDRNAIVIRWGGLRRRIPLDEVEAILDGRDCARPVRFRGLCWPGFSSGRGWVEKVGLVELYSTTPWGLQLVIQTTAGSLAISPSNKGKFLDLYAAQQALGRTAQEVATEERPEAPQAFLQDRWAHRLLALGGVLNLVLMALIAINYHRLPHALTLHLNLEGVADRIGPPSHLFVLAFVGTGVWLVEGALGYLAYERSEKTAAYLLWAGAAGLEILLGVALVGMLGG